MNKTAENINMTTFDINSPGFMKYIRVIKENAITSREIIVWLRDVDEFDTTKFFWCNDIMVNMLGLKRNSDGLIVTKDYYNTFVLDEEGQKFIDELKRLSELIKVDTSIKKVNYIIKLKNLHTEEIFYLDFIMEIFERNLDGTVKSWGGNGLDVTESYKKQKQIKYLAEHDLSTKLYNRNFIDNYIKSDKLQESYVLIVFDMDGLKTVNDTFGHLEGDEAIKLVAGLLSNEFGADSIVGRIGGDEFLIITPSQGEGTISKRVYKVLNEIDEVNKDNVFDLGVSYGSRKVIDNDVSFDDAFKFAESEMYSKKLATSTRRKQKSLDTILKLLGTKSSESEEHGDRMANNAVIILNGLGHNRKREVKDLTTIAKVHDLGKIMLDDSILINSGKLSDNDYRVVKKHSEIGYKIIKNLLNNEVVSLGVLHHHEKWDGTGYPFGLKGENIPLFSRIISICDAFDIMMSGTIYSAPKTQEEIIKELIKCSGTQFEPRIVDVFVGIITENKLF